MDGLDEIIEKYDKLYVALYVKGKLYPGNNPYILNEINAMLKAGWMKKRYGGLTEPIETLEPEDLKWDDDRLQLVDYGERYKYLYNRELEQMSIDNCNRNVNLSYENNERLADEEERNAWIAGQDSK